MLFNRILLAKIIILLLLGSHTTISSAQEYDMKLTFLGTGAPRPSPKRYGPSILLEAGET